MKRKNPPTQQARVLEVLWKKFGGSYVLARQLKLSNSMLNAWKRVTKKVPLTSVGKISRELGVSPFLLNYVEVLEFYGKGPDWEKLILDSRVFTDQQRSYILAGKAPIIPEE